jgi:hypothetical protein
VQVDVLSNCLSGKPESVHKTPYIIVHGYVIRDMLNFLYVTGTTVHLNKWRYLIHENDLYWVIEEKLNPIVDTRFILYKTRQIAEEHLLEMKG